jgi:hypothetical protein
LPRPPESEISFHQDECAHCEMSRIGMMKFPGTATQLPEENIRFLWGEWTTLSAQAVAWILPSYLRSVLTDEHEIMARYDTPPSTSHLIGSLSNFYGDTDADADEVRLRFSLLTSGQLAVLRAMLDYWKDNASWLEWSAEELDAAIAFMPTMKVMKE